MPIHFYSRGLETSANKVKTVPNSDYLMFTKSASEDGPQFRLLKDAFPRLLESSESRVWLDSDYLMFTKSASEDSSILTT